MGVNKDQVEGRIKEVGSSGQQAKGLGKQVTGAAQAQFGDARKTLKDHLKDANKRP